MTRLPRSLISIACFLLLLVGTHVLMSWEVTKTSDRSDPSAPSDLRSGPATRDYRLTLPQPRTVEQVTDELAPAIEKIFAPICRRRKIAWPPARVAILAFKKERRLELWGANATGAYRRLATYPILAASGGRGPKRREGDKQVPEGFYRITELNPNSDYHLSMRVDYPNAEDIRNSSLPLDRMGGDIFIHGDRKSIGCIAVGHRQIEEIFTVVAAAAPADRTVIIAPSDFRRSPRAAETADAPWVRDLYGRIRARLAEFRIEEGNRE